MSSENSQDEYMEVDENKASENDLLLGDEEIFDDEAFDL